MEILDGDIKQQTRQALDNLKEVLLEAGSDFNHIVKVICLVYLDERDRLSLDERSDLN